MPYRISCGPSENRTVLVSHSAAEALGVFRRLLKDGEKDVEIGHLEFGPLSVGGTEVLAAGESANST